MLNIIHHWGNANQTTMRYHFTPTRMARSKSQIIASDEDIEKLEPSYIAVGNVKWCSHV